MSTLKVEVVSIDNIYPHANADKLEICQIAGWQCVVPKGEFKAGDKVVYIPIDSILPNDLEVKLFPPESKVKLSKSRVKTIRLRGAISQGLVVSLNELELQDSLPVGTDVAEALGITKYEPSTSSQPSIIRGNQIKRKDQNSNFTKYTDIQNFKHYNQLFEEGEMVYVTEKLHGTSARYGWYPTEVNTLWRKVKKFFGFLPKYEFCYGSRNVQLQQKSYTGFYTENVYTKMLDQYDLKFKLPEGYSVYGEVVGPGIQKDYTYGLKEGEHRLYIYDIQIDGKYVNPASFLALCKGLNLETVPVLYIGPYSHELIETLRVGDSTIGGQKVREGIVIKPLVEQTTYIGRKVLKYLNDEYLLKDQSDFH